MSYNHVFAVFSRPTKGGWTPVHIPRAIQRPASGWWDLEALHNNDERWWLCSDPDGLFCDYTLNTD
jgi:hypothetical protein